MIIFHPFQSSMEYQMAMLKYSSHSREDGGLFSKLHIGMTIGKMVFFMIDTRLDFAFMKAINRNILNLQHRSIGVYWGE